MPVTATKTFQQRAENSCAPLRTPACGVPSAKGWWIKRQEEKKITERDREREREEEREKRRRKGILFRIPTATKQVRSLAGTVNRQKIYWSSPRAYRWRLSRRNIFLLKHSSRSRPFFVSRWRPLFLHALASPWPPRVHSSHFFLFSFALFYFFRFSVTASEPSRPVDAEITEIDRPTGRPVDHSNAMPSHECFRAKSS